MKEKKEQLIGWIKEHKTELIIAGVGSAVIVAMVVLAINNQKTLEELASKLEKAINRIPDSIPDCTQVAVTSVSEEIVNNEAIVDITQYIYNEAPKASVRPVRAFMRNLPDGWQASAEKIAEAESLGIAIPDGMTMVDPHFRTVAV